MRSKSKFTLAHASPSLRAISAAAAVALVVSVTGLVMAMNRLTPKSYDAPVDQKIDPKKTYVATIKTVKGDLHFTLFPDGAPKHVNSFVFLAREGFYNGLKFHRHVPGFVIQGGDPEGTGNGGPGYNIPLETANNPHLHVAGALGMARSQDPDSAGSQFYICLADVHQLDTRYTVFGQIDPADMATVLKLGKDDVIDSVTIQEK